MSTSSCGVFFLIWNLCFTCFTTTVIAIRFWSNYSDRKGVRLPDYLVIIAYISMISKAATELWVIFNGLGKPTAELTAYELGVLWKFFTAASVTWLFSTIACKLSMLTLYLILFGVSHRFRTVIYITCAIVVVYFIVILALFLTNCHPLSYGWNPVPGGGCRDLVLEEAVIISLNIFLDGLIALLPTPIIWNLKMPLHKKVTIVAMFSLGLSVVGVLIWRLDLTLSSAASPDFSISTCRIALPSALEIWLSMIVISLPSIAPLFQRHVAPRLAYLQLGARKGGAGHAQRRREGVGRAEYTIGGTPRECPGSEAQGMDDSTATMELVDRGGEHGYTGKIEAIKPGVLGFGRKGLAMALNPDQDHPKRSTIEIRTEVSVRREKAREVDSP